MKSRYFELEANEVLFAQISYVTRKNNCNSPTWKILCPFFGFSRTSSQISCENVLYEYDEYFFIWPTGRDTYKNLYLKIVLSAYHFLSIKQ
jgi:hypothetical protein